MVRFFHTKIQNFSITMFKNPLFSKTFQLQGNGTFNFNSFPRLSKTHTDPVEKTNGRVMLTLDSLSINESISMCKYKLRQVKSAWHVILKIVLSRKKVKNLEGRTILKFNKKLL